MPLVGNPTEWGPDTQQGVILSALFNAASGDGRHGADCQICKRAARSLVDSLGTGALRSYRTPTASEKSAGVTGRIELPRGKARFDRLKWKVAEVHAYAS